MTKVKRKKQSKLAYEILGLFGVSALICAVLFIILSQTAVTVVEIYCFNNDIVTTEFDWFEADRTIFISSGIISVVCFCILFLLLFNGHIAYIRTITEAINVFRLGQTDSSLVLEGRNELTQLADAINYMSYSHKQLREKEQALAEEKEKFIHALSHDIRTPLTSILAYSEYLCKENDIPREEQKKHLQMIQKKAEQIRDLTALLLDADKRNPEYFDDAHLLMEQLAAEFEEELEELFNVQTDLSACPSFSGSFDVQEIRRIFDNLSSNVQKYAELGQPVFLSVSVDNSGLCIKQSNAISAVREQRDSYKLGLNSIRRIAQNYSGNVTVSQDKENFSISIILSEF